MQRRSCVDVAYSYASRIGRSGGAPFSFFIRLSGASEWRLRYLQGWSEPRLRFSRTVSGFRPFGYRVSGRRSPSRLAVCVLFQSPVSCVTVTEFSCMCRCGLSTGDPSNSACQIAGSTRLVRPQRGVQVRCRRCSYRGRSFTQLPGTGRPSSVVLARLQTKPRHHVHPRALCN